MRETCSFCAKIASGQADQEACPWDRVLFQSPNFVVLPTVGAIVEGWLLLVPKKHYLCMAALGNDLLSELNKLREYVSLVLQDCYGSIAVFEHGPARPKQAVGCGVDHAHLHMLPTNCNLIDGIREVFPDSLQWRSVKGIQDAAAFYTAELPYLYVEQPLNEAYLASHPNLPSQLFRRVLAAYTGRPERYDWRTFPEEHNVESTVRTLEAWTSRNGGNLVQPKATTL